MPDIAQIVRDAYDRFARGDIPALLELMSEDVQWDVPGVVPQGGSFSGRDGVGKFFAGVAENWAKLEVVSEELVVNGEHVVGIGEARGELAAGERSGYGFTHVFTIRGGQIVRFREYVAVDDKLG